VILYPFTGYLNVGKIDCSYFQQDNPTAHTARVYMTLVDDVFEGRILSNHIWSPWSFNLTYPDYYLWGPMKDAVCRENPHILLELKEAIENFIRNIPANELSHVFANRIKCICINVQGLSEYIHHLQQVHRDFSLSFLLPPLWSIGHP
jgi:hypothetical protein